MTTETVNTGGLKTFSYPRNHIPRRDPEASREIEEGYKAYHKRKKKEATNRAIFCILIALILAVIGFLKNSIYYYGTIIFALYSLYWIWKRLKN